MQMIETNLNFGTMKVRKSTTQIVLHHSGVSILQSVETIHNYHKNHNGWSGIGYHFYVRKNGKIYRGRPENTVGAHAVGANYNSIGICFEGNFEKEIMNGEQLKAGQELVAYIKDKYKISIVKRHKDIDKSICPGKNFPFEELKNSTSVVMQPDKTNPNSQTQKEKIKELQKALNEDFHCKLKEDGMIGPETSKAVVNHYLKYFTQGNFVGWVQANLINSGYSVGKYNIDKKYGKDTVRAVKQYQKDKNIVQDGCVGIETVKMLCQ